MINKSKPFTTGERRSFVTRIRSFTNQTDPANRTESDTSAADMSSYGGNQKQTDSNNNISNKKPSELFSLPNLLEAKFLFIFITKVYKVVHFVGYLRSDLNSNLKYTDTFLGANISSTRVNQTSSNNCKISLS